MLRPTSDPTRPSGLLRRFGHCCGSCLTGFRPTATALRRADAEVGVARQRRSTSVKDGVGQGCGGCQHARPQERRTPPGSNPRRRRCLPHKGPSRRLPCRRRAWRTDFNRHQRSLDDVGLVRPKYDSLNPKEALEASAPAFLQELMKFEGCVSVARLFTSTSRLARPARRSHGIRAHQGDVHAGSWYS